MRRVHSTDTYVFDLDQPYYVKVDTDEQGLSSTQAGSLLPQFVAVRLQDAIETSRQSRATHIVASGTLSFNGLHTLTASIAPGTLNNTSYRVVFDYQQAIFKVSEKTLTGFKVEASAVLGVANSPVFVPYVVLVSPQAQSVTGSTVTFLPADNGVKSIEFENAFSTDKYRVILSPNGFFPCYVKNKTRLGFDIELGVTVEENTSLTVGYDVIL